MFKKVKGFIGSNAFPKYIHFSITNRCNLFCAFCGQDKNKWKKEEELSFEQYKIVIDQIESMKNRTVTFSGGEVFLYKDFLKVIDYCNKKNVPVAMVLTNGTLLNRKRIEALIDNNIKHIGFSLDGTREIHDKIRGIKGSYDKTISAIKTIDEIKKRRKISFPSIGTNFVLINSNLEYIEPLVEEMLKLDVAISGMRFQYLTYISKEVLNTHKKIMKNIFPDINYYYWDKFVSEKNDFNTKKMFEIFKNVKSKVQNRINITFSYNFNEDEVDDWYKKNNLILSKCRFIKNVFFVLPNGDVPLCDFIRYPIGNIKSKSIKEIWKDKRAKRFRKIIDKNLVPGCERCCQLENK
jgi:MoaA/NifB/PqqE/SkfB family radical SAM enzyme